MSRSENCVLADSRTERLPRRTALAPREIQRPTPCRVCAVWVMSVRASFISMYALPRKRAFAATVERPTFLAMRIVRYWHLADVPLATRNVRFRG